MVNRMTFEPPTHHGGFARSQSIVPSHRPALLSLSLAAFLCNVRMKRAILSSARLLCALLITAMDGWRNGEIQLLSARSKVAH